MYDFGFWEWFIGGILFLCWLWIVINSFQSSKTQKIEQSKQNEKLIVQHNSIVIPDHEIPELKKVKRLPVLPRGTTNLDRDNPLRVKELKKLAIETMQEIRR